MISQKDKNGEIEKQYLLNTERVDYTDETMTKTKKTTTEKKGGHPSSSISKVEVPAGSPEDARDTKKAFASSKKRLWFAVGGVLLLIASVLCIVLTLTRKDDSGSSGFSSAESTTTDASIPPCPPQDDSCMNKENFAVCTNLLHDGCNQIARLESCPLQFACADEGATEAQTSNASANGPQCPPQDDPCMNEENFAVCTNLLHGGCNQITHLKSCPLQFACADEGATQAQTSNASANGLPLFSKDVMLGYENSTELKSALELAFTSQAHSYIDQQINQKNSYGNAVYEDGSTSGEPSDTSESAAMGSQPQASAMADTTTAEGGGPTDYSTNNQEANVDEADIIKADANFVYAAYGNYILVWDLSGQKVAQVKMPDIPLPKRRAEQVNPVDTMAVQNSSNANTGSPGAATTSTSATSGGASVSIAMPIYEPKPPIYKPKPYILSLLLTDDYLVAIVRGYNDRYYSGYGYRTAAKSEDPPIMYDYKATQIRLYKKTTNGNLTFVGKKDVNGNFVDARSIRNNIHIATGSSLNIYPYLMAPLLRYQFSKNLTDEQYREQATELATQRLIPDLAAKLTKELELEDGELPRMLQINQWMTNAVDANTTAPNSTAILVDPNVYNVIENVATVTSFNVSAGLDANGGLTTSSSVYMAPSYFSTLYGTEDNLVLATQGWNWIPLRSTSEQTTYLVALGVNGASTQFISVGSLRGNLLNQYALDIVGNELRAATTVNVGSLWCCGPIMPLVAADAAGVAMAAQAATSGSTQTECPAVDDPCMNNDSLAECQAILDKGCANLLAMESCPLQFGCGDDQGDDQSEGRPALVQGIMTTRPPQSNESRTENYMTVMNLIGDEEGSMSKKGEVQIGEKNERISAVRFFDNVAYAVTFEQTDPFYVLDMSVPEVKGKLKLNGFSSYLHSMNAQNTILVAIGQNATNDGRTNGVMVTVFDATDPYNPKAAVSHTFGTSVSGYSSSQIQWDYKAFRLIGSKLIMPLDIWYPQEWDSSTGQMKPLPTGVENFQGFAVLDVSTDAITEDYRISHTQQPGNCYYCSIGNLPTRSFIYSGNLMTVRENTVISSDLETGDQLWKLFLTVDGESMDCCPYNY